MTRDQFLAEMDEILNLPAGTLRGNETLDELKGWDSTALIALISLAGTVVNRDISLSRMANCVTVADILRIAKVNDDPV
jgi:acyl carrier protein